MALTDQDIDRMIKVFATKEDIRGITERMDRLEPMVQGLLTGVDRLVSAFEELQKEYAAVTEQLNRHERWIREIAEKSGVTLKV